MNESVFAPLTALAGKVSIYYKNLVTGDTFTHNAELQLEAASVIKLPTLIHVFRLMQEGKLDKNEKFILKEEDRLPSCGALNVLHTGVELTLSDLYTLMIILSDNTATNMVFRRVGLDELNAGFRALGLHATELNRVLFDSEAAARGLENHISAAEMGMLLEGLYRGTLVSPEASRDMLGILRSQRLKGKIPLGLPRGTGVACKTGEDDGITHDVGIVFAKDPFVLCLCGNEVSAPDFEMALHRVARTVYELNQ